MATTLAYLLVRLGVDAKEFGTKMKAAEKTMDSVANGMKKAGNALSVGVTAPMLAVAGASLKMAMDAEESENLFTIAMGGMADSARKWSEEISAALGLNAYAVREQVALFNSMFTAMGMSEQGAFDMSKGLTQLAYDMASFFNLKPEEAFDKLRAGITGEGDALKKLGILIDEATIKEVAYQSGLVKTGEELTGVQKVQARYIAIMQQTSKAQGDLARTLDSPTNQLRRLKAEMETTAIELGKALIPLLKESVPILRDFAGFIRAAAEALNRMDPETRKVVLGSLALLAALGPVTRAFGIIVDIGSAVGGAFATAAREAAKLAKAQRAASAATTATTVATEVAGASTARYAARQVATTATTVTLTSANIRLANSFKAVAMGALSTAGPVAIVGMAAVGVGDAIRPSANELEGMAEMFGLVASKSQDLGDALVANKDQFLDALSAYDATRTRLGLVGEQWEIGTRHTEANARALADNLTKLERLSDAYRAHGGAIEAANDRRGRALAQVTRHMELIAREDAALRDVTDKLKEMYGVLGRQDVVDKMNALVADFTLLAKDGVAGAELMEAFAPKVAELSEAAKGYVGLNVPGSFQELQWVLEKGLVGWVDDLGGRLSRDIPDAAGQAQTALASSIGNAMLEAKGTVSKETEEIKNLLMTLADETYVIPVKVDLDTQAFDRWLKDHGLEPDTVGSAP
jgi:hypothetical protein